MPMSNESLEKPAKPAKNVTNAPEPAGDLLNGAASGDPAVHQLMANRYIASMNGDEQAYANYTAQLAELGYK